MSPLVLGALVVLFIILILIVSMTIAFFLVKVSQTTTNKWLNVSMYAIIIILFLAVFAVEVSTGFLPLDMTISSNTATASDSCSEIAEKTSNITSSMGSMVNWRLAFLFGFIGSTLIWALSVMRIPTWQEFYISLIILFLLTYGFLSFYSHHLGGQAAKSIDKNFKLFLNKCYTPR